MNALDTVLCFQKKRSKTFCLFKRNCQNSRMFCPYVLLVLAGRTKVPQGSFVKM